MPTTDKLRVLVLFGGPTVEHEVTIVTALQVIAAIDPRRFEALPVYWAPDGQFYTGEMLAKRESYPFTPDLQAKLTRVEFPLARKEQGTGRAVLTLFTGGLFKKTADYAFDAVLPVAHGTMVEDGNMQGFYSALGVPFTGCGTMAASVFMNKMATKKLLASYGVPVLPAVTVERPRTGFADVKAIADALELPSNFPVIVKPNFLGSSIGVTRATNRAELAEGIAKVFKFDTTAIVEPCVAPLVEYNISVTRAFGDEFAYSAIERPLTKEEGDVLDFEQKYHAAGGGKKTGTKSAMPGGTGMASATRIINPPELAANGGLELIRNAARTAMTATGGKGAPRIDFISNGDTGEIWLNEVNPIPGSFAYFLWEYAENPKTFTELLTALIDEALLAAKASTRLTDAEQAGARMFKR